MEYVVSVDTSDESKAAVREAAQLAENTGATLTLVHCVQRDIRPDEGGPVREGLAEAEDRGHYLLTKRKAQLDEYSVSVSTELVYGNGVDAVVDYLEQNQPEAVYIGHRDLPKRREELEGSFAKRLIGESPVPVTVVCGTQSSTPF